MVKIRSITFEQKVALGYVTPLPNGGYHCNICGQGGAHWFCACADFYASKRLDELQPEE